MSILTPVNNIFLFDSGLQKIFPSLQYDFFHAEESQGVKNTSDLVASLEKNLLWQEVQLVKDGTIPQGFAPEGIKAVLPPVPALPSSSYHPNYNTHMPHHEGGVGIEGQYASFSNLDTALFSYGDTDNVSVFYETAVDGEFAEAANLPKEIPPLGYFSYDTIEFDLSASEQIDPSVDRLTQLTPEPAVVTPEPQNLPPVAGPNDYTFSADIFDEGGTNSPVLFAALSSRGTDQAGPFQFILGNILTDPENPSLPVSATNPVDADPEGTSLIVNSISHPTLTIAGNAVALTAVSGSLPAGEVAEYQFTYQGQVGVLIISQDGTLSLETGARNLFVSLAAGEEAIFGFDYTNRDGDGLISNAAHVDLMVQGVNDAPVAQLNTYA
ncbi:MAG: VCBS domain-containing protein, partial [Caedimonas sp.]|nr:VCBS domain-containing protein [Caedimonas sp.]